MFVPGIEMHKVTKSVDEIRHQDVKQGRNPDHIKIIGGILIPVDETDKKARAKYEDYINYIDFEGTLALFRVGLEGISTNGQTTRISSSQAQGQFKA